MQHWSLSFLSRSGFAGVFKGGTCLQKCFGLPRYSEDLDFTLNGALLPDFVSLQAFLASAGFAVVKVDLTQASLSDSAKMRYRGPLYNGNALSEGTLRFEFSKREKALLPPTIETINSPYPDLLAYSLRVMDLSEIAAEKMRALLTRSSARDLFDLNFLLQKGVALDAGLVQQKLDFYSVKYDYASFKKRVGKLRKDWKAELKAFTPNYLDYVPIAKKVLAETKKMK